MYFKIWQEIICYVRPGTGRALLGEKNSKALLQNRSLAPLTGAFQSFRPAPPSFIIWEFRRGDFKCPGLRSSLMGDEFARSTVHVRDKYGNCYVINFVSSQLQLKLFVYLSSDRRSLCLTMAKREIMAIYMQRVQQHLLYFCRSCYPKAPPKSPKQSFRMISNITR